MKTIYVNKLSEEEKDELTKKGFKVIDVSERSSGEEAAPTMVFLVLLAILLGSVAIIGALFAMVLESPETLLIFIPLALGMHYFFNLGEKDEK